MRAVRRRLIGREPPGTGVDPRCSARSSDRFEPVLAPPAWVDRAATRGAADGRRCAMPAATLSDPEAPDRELRSATSVFMTYRPRLFGIAYRMLGSVAEAEDLVQEVWLRWQHCDRDGVREPAAFLAVTTS